MRKSPPRALRLEVIDDQTGLRMNTETCANAPDRVIVISGPDNQDITGRPTRGPGYLSPPTSPTAKTLPPPPNATVVVCVLAGTGRADLWIRNNRGQTPLDLCPADQPLRRALIKCCDAAARARSLRLLPISKTETGSTPTTAVQQRLPQQLKLESNYTIVSNNVIKIPHRPLATVEPESSKECSKTLPTQNYFEHVNQQTNCVNNVLSASDISPLSVVPSQDNDISSTAMAMPTTSNSFGNIDEVTTMVASIDLGTKVESSDNNQNDCNAIDINSDHGDNKAKCSRQSSSPISDNSDRFV